MKSDSNPKRQKIGQMLLNHKIITPRQLAESLVEQKRLNAKSKRKFKIGEILLYLGHITVLQLQAFLSKQATKFSNRLEKEEALSLTKLHHEFIQTFQKKNKDKDKKTSLFSKFRPSANAK